MITLFNTLTKQKEVFKPLDPDHVRMYVCGPTVYDFAHMGNARPCVVFDVLARILRQSFPKVTYVSNVTDVDDKINEAATKSGESIFDLTTKTLKAFQEDMAYLGVGPPDIQPKATDHIQQMIDMIDQLIQKNHAYETNGHVLFDVTSFKNYGLLSRRNQEELIAGARVEVCSFKKNPADFVLWKPSTSDLPGWDSPWGRGRPGWHIECSAMAKAYLGETFDIHCGGIDLVFPHHENEIAQSRCVHKSDIMAKYWLHNGHLTISGDKMSKSLGNFRIVREYKKHYRGEILRLALLLTHYRQPLDWNQNVLDQSQSLLNRFYQAVSAYHETASPQAMVDEEFFNDLCDDLNTPKALRRLSQMIDELNQKNDPKLAQSIIASGYYVGILQAKPQEWFQGDLDQSMSVDVIEDLIQKRQNARKNKNWEESDRIRDELNQMGLILEDKGDTTIWKKG